MAVEVPYPNQIVVFWLDPKLTLETYGDDDAELVELVSNLPYKKYVGRVSKLIPAVLPNSLRPYAIQFVTWKKSPLCPAVLIDGDMAFPLEPSAQQDLPFPPVPTAPPLPWKEACLPVYFGCNILCRPFESETTPTTIPPINVTQMERLSEPFRERRRQLEAPLPDDSDSEESLDFDADDQGRDDVGSTLSSRASDRSNADEHTEHPLAIAAKIDPLGRLWWSMKNPHSDFSERPADQLSTDLSLVPDLSTIDPFDFAREYQSLLRVRAEHKARKIVQAQEQNDIVFKDLLRSKSGPKQWARILSRKRIVKSTVPCQRLYSCIRSRLSAVFTRCPA